MLSVTSAAFNAIAGTNTLSLFKTQSEDKTAAKVVTPTIKATSSDRLSLIADLAAKLIDLKSDHADADTTTPATPPRIGDRIRPLTTEERAAEKANWEAYYQAQDDRDHVNFPGKITALLLQNDLYKNDPSFQAALKNGTLSVESGEVIGLSPSTRTLFFSDGGYYAGVSGSGFETPKDIWSKIETIDGRFVSKSDGKNVAIGLMNSTTFYVTWPSA